MTGNVSTDNNGGFVRLSNRIDSTAMISKVLSLKPKATMKL